MQPDTSEEYKLYKTLQIALEDIFMALHYAHIIVKNNWHYHIWEKRQPTHIKQTAWTTALIITYCRPFGDNKGLSKISKELKAYTREQRKLHNKIYALRDEVFAHSDGKHHEVKPFAGRGELPAMIARSWPELRLSKEEVQELMTMMKNLEKELQIKRRALEKIVSED